MNEIAWKSLVRWFEEEKRDFPWRENSTPYAVWVSEVMLQQTRASVVIPYFLNWMEKFPTIKALANAPLDRVIKEWEGLGYYSRARNLHEGARYVIEHFGGELPSSPEQLKKIKGLGPYTVGAIRSFAFKEKAAAVDGNVIRVLCRLFGIEEDIAHPQTVKKIWAIAEEILPDHKPWVIAEALIELGATLCNKPAQCRGCPLKNSCSAYSSGKQELIPFKSKKVTIEPLYRTIAVIQHRDKYLVRRGKTGEIMADLHEFPFFEEKDIPPNRLQEKLKSQWGIDTQFESLYPHVTHTFTRFKARLQPIHLICENFSEIPEMQWKTLKELKQLAFSSGHRKIYQHLISLNDCPE